MWDCSVEILDERTRRYSLSHNTAPMRYMEAIHAWQHEASFRTYFNQVLADAPFAAYRWETPPMTAATIKRAFEFVLIDSPALVRRADKAAFAAQFASGKPNQTVSAFPNLGNDAVLVVPHPPGANSAFVHLADFVRGASEEQQHELWRVVGGQMQSRISSAPLWLSTAGMGVAWLHIRLDSRPKYYGFAPYTSLP